MAEGSARRCRAWNRAPTGLDQRDKKFRREVIEYLQLDAALAGAVASIPPAKIVRTFFHDRRDRNREIRLELKKRSTVLVMHEADMPGPGKGKKKKDAE